MAYFGDATVRALILGVALALSFSISGFVGVLAVTLGIANIVTMLSGRRLYHGYVAEGDSSLSVSLWTIDRLLTGRRAN